MNYMFSRIFILSLIGGCVANNELNLLIIHALFSWGFSINICATSLRLTASMRESCDIDLSAEARAWGFLVSSTAQASARYSLFLDSANRRSDEMKYPTIASASHIINAGQLFLLSDLLQ